jgi:glutathione-regulated potassium-efflux system ancillary protein KefG
VEGTIQHRTLVVLGHPSPEDSRVNRHLADSLRGLPDVSVRDLAAVRGANGFDVTAEQEALRAHGTLVLQFPWHWYSVPGILKEWMDQVFTHGFAYGTGGDALHGKRLLVATSTGGPEESYAASGFNRFTMAELMRPIEATAHLCGMNMLPPLVLHGARAVDDAALAAHTLRYRGILTGTVSAALTV